MVLRHADTIPAEERGVYLVRAASHFISMKAEADNYVCLPVDVQTFIESDEGMAKRRKDEEGVWRCEVYPKIMDELRECNSGRYVEATFTGAIGTGKTTSALYSLVYQLYMLSCLKNPHRLFDLDEASEIVFIFQSLKAATAEEVGYDRFFAMINTSPYFLNHFMYDRSVKTELIFPKRIIVRPMSGLATAAIGQNVFGGLLDEVNFMKVVEKSRQSADGGEYNQANEIYNSISRRRKTRFIKRGSNGKLPGLLCLVSSKRYPGEFTDKKMEEAKKEIRENGFTRIFVYDKRPWDVMPAGTYGNERFKLFLGDLSRKPRIMEADETVADEDANLVMEIPVEFKSEFERDILSAIRDVAGCSTFALHPFIVNTEAVAKAFGRGPSILTLGETDFVTTRPGIILDNIRNKDEPRLAHIDLGLTGDSAGVCVGHVEKFVEVARKDGMYDMLPLIRLDLILRVPPPRNGEIEFESIRTLLYKLREVGVNLKWISFDTFQSADSMQLMRHKGFITGPYSIDKTSMPYEVTKTAFYDERIIAPQHKKALEEMIRLERDPEDGLIDHPEGGCFTGETRVALANGTNPTFRELATMYKPDEIFYVYSIGPEGLRISPARNARVTKQATELVEVELDNYQTIRCTPDHPFMTLQGEWVLAKNLTPDISLMPLYRSVGYKGGTVDYERVWCPVRERRFLTHHVAVGEPEHGYIVHHRDENKRNNDPRNLIHMTRAAHYSHHGKEFWCGRQQAMNDGHKAHYEDGGREAASLHMRTLWEEGKLGPRRADCAIEGCYRKSNARGLCDMHYQRAKRAKTLPSRTIAQKNHRVLSIRHVVANEPVYDLTVPGTENFALSSGVFVHNSKDCADAIAGVVFGLTYRREVWFRHKVPMRDFMTSMAERIEKKDKKSEERREAGMHRHHMDIRIQGASE
jgi:hypothetical protein